MISVTVYGGANEIGGNKILLEFQGTRIMLDFGSRMGFDSRFFSEFVNPRTNTGLRDRLIMGSLPMIPGIYREDLIRPSGLDGLPEEGRLLEKDSPMLDLDGLITYEEYLSRWGKGYIDGILLSHAHLDHTGDITHIHPDIPVYCSSITKTLVDAIDQVTAFKTYALEMKRPEITYSVRGMFPGSPKLEKKNVSRRDCITTSENTLGNVYFELIDVDHSVPGACSFLIKNGKRKILYTGDIRFHGTSRISVEHYARRAGDKIDMMICEGTRVDSGSVITEEMVCQDIACDIRSTKGVVFVDFSWKDTTRFETIRRAAMENNRIFVINGRLAYILRKLGLFPDDDSVRVFLKRSGSALYSPNDYTRSKHELGFISDHDELDTTHYQKGITASQITEAPGKYVLMMSYYDFNQLFDFADENGKIRNSLFIKAQCEPFCDDMEIDEERLINWLELFGIGFREGEPDINPNCTDHDCSKIKRCVQRSHVSGHASRPELKELIKRLKPDVLIPVHTLYPHEFSRIAEEIEEEDGHGIRVVIPETGVEYTFGDE